MVVCLPSMNNDVRANFVIIIIIWFKTYYYYFK